MGEIIDFTARETRRRHERIQALLYKALTGELNDRDLDELRRLSRQRPDNAGTTGESVH